MNPNQGAVALNYTIGEVTNCTVADNAAPGFGGIVFDTVNAGVLTLRNIIAYHNLPAPDLAFNRQIENVNGWPVTVTYCDIEDVTPNDGIVPFGAVNGNIDTDPMFRDELNGDLRLMKASLAIDRGETPPVPNDALNADGDASGAEKVPDVRLLRRVADLPSAPNLGVGDDCGIIDIGAHEYVITGDLNGDGVVNGLDIQPFTFCYIAGNITGFCEEADVYNDGVSNFDDVTCLIAALIGDLPCALDCPDQPGGGEGGGGAPPGLRSAGGGGDQTPTSPPPGAADEPVEESPDPALEARWNTFVDWFDANQPEAHPEMTEEAWDAWVTDVMMDTLYGDESP